MKRSSAISFVIFIGVVYLVLLSCRYKGKITWLEVGTYGHCDCLESEESKQNNFLKINSDNTFHYYDATNPARVIDVKGKWVRDNGNVRLSGFEENSVPAKWKIDGKCLKSRKGLLFRRLCISNQKK
jgi:hypothetical protein